MTGSSPSRGASDACTRATRLPGRTRRARTTSPPPSPSLAPQGDLPIYVKTVFERGAAADEGTLRRGDMLRSVNGTSLAGVTHQQAVAILTAATGTVTLIVES